MKLYQSVVICCDKSPKLFQDAIAIRSALEAFGLRVHLYDLAQKRDALEFLAGAMPECEYVILLCHGGTDAEGSMQLTLNVVDQVNGNYNDPHGWERVTLALTPVNITDYVRGRGRTLICPACGAGQEPFTQAFLKAGYKDYVAPLSNYINANAAMMFIINFFYYLLWESRIEDEPICYTNEEAAVRAAALDVDYVRGTRLFQYYS